MTFIHPLLLGGLALISVPVLLHLLMRQQPKLYLFPAVRFLQKQVQTNKRKLRLRHWLLLLLRSLLIALMCLALARPRLFSDRIALAGDQAAAVVLAIDTSASMGYTTGGQNRLDAAKARALELLDEISEQGRVAILDSAEPVPEWQPSVRAAREKVAALELRPANQPMTAALDAAYRMLRELTAQEADVESLPRFVYMFSDRTPNSWDASRVADLSKSRESLGEPKVKEVYIDVGVDEPADLAVTDLRIRPQIVPQNRPVVLEATLRATGMDFNTELVCRFNGSGEGERKPVAVKAGQSAVISFEKRGLDAGFHQAEVAVITNDSLPFNNTRFASIEVRPPQKLLILCDDKADPYYLSRAIDFQGRFQCDVRSLSDPATRGIGPADLAKYKTVLLFNVARPGQSGRDLWDVLESYVKRGGTLGIIPGGEEVNRDDYNRADSAARRLMPAELVRPESVADGVTFAEFSSSHPLIAPFREDSERPETDYVLYPRRTFWYWNVQPADKANVLLRYAGKERSPAIIERIPEGATGRGKVVLLTTPLDLRQDARGRGPNDYNAANSFFFVLANRLAKYLAGETDELSLNFLCGQPVTIPLPVQRLDNQYVLQGPGLTGADTQVQRPDNAAELVLVQAKQPGIYTLQSPDRGWTTSFSLNLPPAEGLLLPRLGVDSIEAIFGEGAVVMAGQSKKLRDALEGQLRQPIELFPWLMLAVLLALTLENWLANRFYRKSEPAEATKSVGG